MILTWSSFSTQKPCQCWRLSLNGTIGTPGGFSIGKCRARKVIFVLLLTRTIIGSPNCINGKNKKNVIKIILFPLASNVPEDHPAKMSLFPICSCPCFGLGPSPKRRARHGAWEEVQPEAESGLVGKRKDWQKEGEIQQVKRRGELEGLASFDFSVLFSF